MLPLSPHRLAVRSVMITKGFLILFFIVALSFIPIPGNYKIYSVQSGSMYRAITTGSIVFVRPLSKYSVNDIVTFRTAIPKQTITHRIVRREQRSRQTIFITRGDANKTNDSNELLPQNIIGKVFFIIPLLGYPISYAKTLPGLIVLIVIPATIIVYSELITIKNKLIAMIKKKHEHNH